MRAPDRIARKAGAALVLACVAASLAFGGPRPAGAAPAAAAAPPERPLQGAERDEAFSRLRESQRDVRSLRAAIVQRRAHPLLAKEAVTEGMLLFRKPNLLRFELEKPEKTLVVIDGETMTSYRPARKEAERKDLRGDFAARAAAEFLATGLTLSLADLEKRFHVDLYRNDGDFVLRMSPRSKWLARVIASITILQGKDDVVPRRIVVQGTKGDRTETMLAGVTVNPPLPEDAFALRLAPGVRVTETGGAPRSPDDAP